MATSIRIEGLADALRQIAEIPRAMRHARDEILHDWADDVEADAKANVPVNTGELEESIEQKVNASVGVATVGVWKEEQLAYAEHVEKGTSSMSAQPYLVPAFEQNRANVAPEYRAAFRRWMGYD